MADALQALAVVRAKLSNFPDHGARDGAAVYKITGAELGLIVDALAARQEGHQSSGERVKAIHALYFKHVMMAMANETRASEGRVLKALVKSEADLVALLAPQAAPVEQKTKHTMTLNLTDEEMAALEEIAKAKDVSPRTVFRQALKVFQLQARGMATITMQDIHAKQMQRQSLDGSRGPKSANEQKDGAS